MGRSVEGLHMVDDLIRSKIEGGVTESLNVHTRISSISRGGKAWCACSEVKADRIMILQHNANTRCKYKSHLRTVKNAI